MKVNHTVHYSLLDHDILNDLKGIRKIVTWLLWCKVIHLTKFTGKAVIQQTQMAQSFKTHQRQIQAAVEHLTKHRMIKCLQTPQYSKGIAGEYITDTACIQLLQSLYPKGYKPVSDNGKPVSVRPKAVSNPDYLNNSKNSNNSKNINEGNDSSFIKESSPSHNNQPHKPKRTMKEDIEYLNRIQRERETNGKF